MKATRAVILRRFTFFLLFLFITLLEAMKMKSKVRYMFPKTELRMEFFFMHIQTSQQLAKPLYDEKVQPTTLIPKQVGNMYTASLYAAFASLLHNKHNTLVNTSYFFFCSLLLNTLVNTGYFCSLLLVSPPSPK